VLMRKHDDAGRRMWDLDRLARLAGHYQTIRAFLRAMALESPPMAAGLREEGDELQDALTLSTIDAAAGREWSTVFVLNVTSRDLSTRAGWTARSEQKALIRVAVTRSRERLYLIRPCPDADDDNEEPPDLPAVLEGLPANLLKRTRARLGRPR
jgi:superfamily I DNA/RNA helicase